MQPLFPSAHQDTFARDHLPPPEEWPDLVFDLPELRYPQQLNCAQELLDATVARLGPDRPALIDGSGRTWSYGDLLDRVDRIARVLVDGLGLVPGNRVLLRGPNSPWLAACWLALLKAGGVAVTTMALLRAGELRSVIGAAHVDFALCDERYTDELLAAGLPPERLVTYGTPDGGELARLASQEPVPFTAVPTSADDIALIAFTSGTSGEPKATMHFHRDVLAIADTFSAHVLRPRSDDVFAGSPPLAFTFGLGGLLVFPMRVGAAALLLEDGRPGELFAAVAEHRVSVLFTAPTAYRWVLREGGAHDLRSLRRCVSAGETLPPDTWHAFLDATGLRIIDGIGSTEMLHIFISAADEEIRPGATGTVVPGFRARVVDDEGLLVPDGVAGRLEVRGPTGCRYLADLRQRDQVHDGWTATGDIFVRDPDGYFHYRARCDDMIVTAGYNVAAPEVEQVLVRHPAVREAAVVGIPDPDRGQVVKGFVVLEAGAVPGDRLSKEIQDFVKAEIAPYKYPRLLEFITKLPTGATGKLQRHALRGDFGDGTDRRTGELACP